VPTGSGECTVSVAGEEASLVAPAVARVERASFGSLWSGGVSPSLSEGEDYYWAGEVIWTIIVAFYSGQGGYERYKEREKKGYVLASPLANK